MSETPFTSHFTSNYTSSCSCCGLSTLPHNTIMCYNSECSFLYCHMCVKINKISECLACQAGLPDFDQENDEDDNSYEEEEDNFGEHTFYIPRDSR